MNLTQYAKAQTGKFQLRNGRAASIFTVNTVKSPVTNLDEKKFEGLILPINAQGKTETGHFWREDGSYSVAPIGILHHLDLLSFLSEEITLPNNE